MNTEVSAAPSRDRFLYCQASHASWWVTRQLETMASRPITGVMLMGSHGWGASSNSIVVQQEQMAKLRGIGLRVVPGVILMDGGTATDWTNPRTWQWASLWMTAVTAPGEPFVVDFEPYFASGKYPSYSLALAQAISPLAEVAKARGNQLWMVPGTRALRTEGDVISRTAYIPAAVLNGMLPGKLVNCDESMYGLSPEVRPENWRTILSTAATDSLWAGEQYMPGLLVESLKDEELQLELESKKMASWVYATPTQLQSIPSWEAATES